MIWSVESTGAAKTPSTAFCLLLRLFTIRCTENQMKLMLDHVDSPYIRCIGFLYLRYAADPGIIWKSFQPYLYDQESVKIRANVNSKDSTVGDFVRGLLTDLEFYGTRLPRLPVGIEKEIKVKLLLEEEIEQRAQRHLSDSKVMEYFEKIGSRVQAMYGDEENEVAWYDAVVDRVLRKDDETGLQFYRPKFIVTFPEYGNTEVVSLGEMDMPGVVDHTPVFPSGSKGGDARRGSSSDYRSYDEYRHDSRYNYREKVESSPGYGRRKQDSYGVRGYRRDDSRVEIRNRDKHRYNDDDRHLSTRHCRSRSRSRDRSVPDEKELSRADNRRDRDNKATIDDFNHAQRDPIVVPTKTQTKSENMKKEEIEPKPATKTPEQLAALAEKKRKLLAKYG
jgi:pre-mRNA-splicing factor 38B